jgi:hypothetical protein
MKNVIDMNVCMDIARSLLKVIEFNAANHCIGNAEGCWMYLRRDSWKDSKAIGLIARGLSGRLPGGGRARPASCGRANLSLLEPKDLIVIERQLVLLVDD